LGKFNEALNEAERGLQRFPDPSTELHWRFRTLKAEILMRTGRAQEALDLLAPDPPQVLVRSDIAARRKLTQCGALTFLGRFKEATEALKVAQELVAAGLPELAGDAALRQGTLAFRQGRIDEAQLAYRKMLTIARDQKNPFWEIAALGSLGLTAIRLEHYDESLDLHKQARELAEKVSDLDSLARIEGNIGFGYHEVGDLEKALESDNKAAALNIQNGAPGRGATWLSAAGDVYYELHDYTSAESKSSEALKIAESLQNTEDAISCLQNLALVAIARKQFDIAKKRIDDALSREGPAPEHDRQIASLLISAQLASETGDFAAAESSYSQIARDGKALKSDHWQAVAGLARVHASGGKNSLAEHEFRDAINTISDAEDSICDEEARLSFLSVAIRFFGNYVNFLVSLHRPNDAIRVADLSRAQTLNRGLSPRAGCKAENQKAYRASSSAQLALKPEDIARRQNATLLFYWLGRSGSYLWVINPSKTSFFPLPSASEIESAVKSYRDTFVDPRDPFESGKALGTKLYESLVLPAAKVIPKNSRIIVLPDGPLNALNFETLIVPGPNPHYWIEDVTISNANSLSLLARARLEAPPKESKLLFFGDALFASKEFPVLPESGKEADILKKYFPESHRSLFTKADAKASAYLSSSPGRYSYLHFATHGTASSARPLESAIILSPEGDSFKLYARDIVQRPLNAYLVTISACNGAGVKVYAGEGLIGLSWAFVRAGAHNVIGGLWEVSNASTPQLMDELYKGLNKGDDPAVALRNAKLGFVHSSEYYSRPFYWAPFQLYSGS
jgi:CHAT domain-containing protein